LVDRPNVFVKIPATEKGLPAISACLAEGMSINVTLIFSLDRYADVVEAFLDGLERARDRGLDLSTIASVASLFVSRVDTEIDRRLDEIGGPDSRALRGRAGIANARLAYRHHEQSRATDRWRGLQQAGARPQRPLWASTGVKDPTYPDTRYVVDLVAPGVVNTMPEATLDAVADHAQVPVDSIHGTYGDAERVLAELAAVGIDYGDVMQVLEAEGVEKFDASWEAVGEELARSLGTSGPRGSGGDRLRDVS
jgi:transaldolase